MGTSQFSGRTHARIQALQLLFQAEAVGRSVDDVLDGDYVLYDAELEEYIPFPDEYAVLLAQGVDGMRHELDRAIARHSHAWSISRMPAVDLNLMRIALYEMTCVDEVEIPVAIDTLRAMNLRMEEDADNKPYFEQIRSFINDLQTYMNNTGKR